MPPSFWCETYSASPTSTVGQLVCHGAYGNAKPDTGTENGINYGTTAALGSSSTFGTSYEENDDIGGYLNGGGDTIYYVQCFASGFFGYRTGSIVSAKTNASAAVMATPTSSSVASTTATISTGTVTTNVNSSTWTLYLYYKRASDPSYTLAGSSSSSNPLSVNLTGLDSSTQYYFYAYLVRGTNNDTTATSSVQSFTTLAGEPEVTTDAATGVTASAALLNATVEVNEGTTVTVYWKWGPSNPPTENTTASQDVSADGSFESAISGLSDSTLYYAQAYVAFATPSGTPNSGSVVSFTTPADPALEAAEEDHVRIFYFDRKYGVEDAVTFTVPDVASSSSDRFYNAASPFASGDVKISIDGGAIANTTNLPTRIGSTPLFTLTLTAAELQGSEIDVYLVDQNGPVWRDTLLKVRTELLLGNVQIDAATGQKANTSALAVTGYGTGHGLSAVAGATGFDVDGILGQHVQRGNTATAGGASTITLDASASATNDYYNGSIIMIVGGTGVGQARVITDYVGATKVATVDSSWSTNPASGSVFVIVGGARTWDITPDAELSAIPSATASYGSKLQALFQRFFFKRTQTTTTQTLFKADSSTSLGTATVSDDGATQTSGKIS